jgi:hypothetical protein
MCAVFTKTSCVAATYGSSALVLVISTDTSLVPPQENDKDCGVGSMLQIQRVVAGLDSQPVARYSYLRARAHIAAELVYGALLPWGK